MAEFPREQLLAIVPTFTPGSVPREAIWQAIKAYDELSDRLLRDRVTLSLQIANLRARLREVDPQFSEPHT